MAGCKYEPKSVKWARLSRAADAFLNLRTKGGNVPAEAPEITELIESADECRALVLEKKGEK